MIGSDGRYAPAASCSTFPACVRSRSTHGHGSPPSPAAGPGPRPTRPSPCTTSTARPRVTIGYWAGPGLIQDAPKEGWFRTGDLMRRGEGDNLWFVSRKKDLIIRGGSNIAPTEVERVLLAHPAVGDAAVVGVPDAVLGQRVATFVQLAGNGSGAVIYDILGTVRAQLADHKDPESLQILRDIPRNALGKIDRKQLLEMVPPREGSEAIASSR
jgi:long-chain acyl-CoA synthetase